MTLLDVAAPAFAGLPPQIVQFLDDLRRHNTRDWFHAHRGEYETVFLAPARALVLALGERLSELGPGIHAEPKVYGSILAINRDVRFSADKTPYKTHLDLWLWEGSGPSRECAGYFVRLDPDAVTLGVGVHHFTTAGLAAYRRAVDDARRGPELDRAVRSALTAGARFGPARWKRVPAPYAADHPRAELLRHDGLVAATTDPLPPQAQTEDFPDWCVERWAPLRPLQTWVAAVAKEAAGY
jgi:uncharacterized protein (TIGR02453 family)